MNWFNQLNYIYQALLGGTLTFLLAALGTFSVYLFAKINDEIICIVSGFSGGVMIVSAFYSLLSPAIQLANELNQILNYSVFIGILLGLFFYVSLDFYFKKKTNKSSILLLTSMTIHNIPEGLCVGVAFGGVALGLRNLDLVAALSLTLAIGLQNFPEGIACSLPLYNSGYTKKKSVILGSLSAIVEPISAVIGCLLVILINNLLPYLLSFAAAIMIMVAITDLLPEAISKNKTLTCIGFFLGFIIMLILEVCL